MAAPFNDLASKAEAAAKAVVDTLSLSTTHTINTGLDDDTLGLPCVVCEADNGGEEMPKGSGNFWVHLAIELQSEANDKTLVNHRSDFAKVADAFQDDGIATTLSGHVSDFYVFETRDVKFGRSRGERGDGTAIMADFIELDILACGTDIS